jgi:hypothetical protein
MRDEVEEFLRRVAQMRAQAEAQAKAAQQRPAQQQPPPPPQQPPQQPARRLVPAREAGLQPMDVEVIDAELAESERLGRVPRPISSAEALAERTRLREPDVYLADEVHETRLRESFDHKVGQKRQSTTDEAAAAPSDAKRAGFTAGSIVDMLLSPDSIRNAIILGEVLRRPDERW